MSGYSGEPRDVGNYLHDIQKHLAEARARRQQTKQQPDHSDHADSDRTPTQTTAKQSAPTPKKS